MTLARFLPLLLIGMLGIGAATLWWPSTDVWEAFFHDVERWGPWIGVVLIGLMILHNFVPIPAEMIAICAGMTSGLLMGVVYVWIGAMLGALLAFWIASHFGRGLAKSEKVGRWLTKLERLARLGDWKGLIAVRLIPVVSFNLVNYGAGLAGVPLRLFLWTTAIGILPITILSVAAGAGLKIMGGGTALAVIGITLLAILSLKQWRRSAV